MGFFDDVMQGQGDAAPSGGGGFFADVLAQPPQVTEGVTAPVRVYIGDRQPEAQPVSNGERLLTDFQNQGIAAGQRTTPVISAQTPNLVSSDVFQNDAGEIQYRDPATGQLVTTDRAKHVVLRDPSDQKLKVYARTDNTNEGILASLGRILGMGAASNAPTRLPGGFAAPLAPVANGPLGVTLSTGQATGALPLIQREQAALRGTSGAAVQGRAQQFADQQGQQVAAAKDAVAQSLNPAGTVVAASPQEAGGIVSAGLQKAVTPSSAKIAALDAAAQKARGVVARSFAPSNDLLASSPHEAGQAVSAGVRGAASSAKANVDASYRAARGLGGEIHAGAFEGLPQKIKGELTLSSEPVVIDQNTPVASRMIDYLDQKVGQLNIPNKADPFGAPNPQNIVGVSLSGVEQWRKALSTLRSDALASNNAADQRAARAVIDSFDNHIDQAVNSGLFTGDPRAVQAWNDARAAHSAYRKTFTGNSKDAAGRVIEKIIGRGQNPAAIPNDVADFLYGSSGVNPGSLNVSVANRVKEILGEKSPQWAAVKQGLFSRLVDSGAGVTDFQSARVADRINKFLRNDGKELANAIYSPQEQSIIQRYADALRRIEQTKSSLEPDATAKVIEKIIGGGVTPNDVADALFGASGINPGSLNVSVANRVKGVLGESSREWSAVKQGLFSRLVDAGDGMTQFGPGKVAQRINKFLNNDGKELSGVLYKPEERALIQQYGDLMRQLEVPQAGANWSNTATFTSKALKKTGHLGAVLGTLIDSAVGHATGMPEMVGEVVGAGVGSVLGGVTSKAGDALAVRSIAKQMPLIRVSVARYEKALANYQRSQLPAARSSLSAAAANLASSLRPLGIEIKEIGAVQRAVNAETNDEQRNP